MHDMSRPRHHGHARRIASLEQRDPALFTVSQPFPTIPILSPLLTPILDPLLEPLLTPLIAGLFPSTTTTQTTQTTQTTLPTTTSPTAASATATSGTSSETETATNSASTSGSSGAGSNTTGASATTSGASSAHGTGTSVSGSQASLTAGNATASNGAASPDASAGVSDGAASEGAGGGGVSDGAGSEGAGSEGASGGGVSTPFQIAAAVEQATATDSNGNPLFTFSDPIGSTTGAGTTRTTATSTPRASGTHSGTVSGSTGTSDIPSGTGGAASSSHQHGGLSAGAIAGIVIAAILLMASLFVFCVRQRRMRKRAAQRRNWWRGGPVIPEGSMHSGGWSNESQLRNSVRSSTSSFSTPITPYTPTFSIPAPSPDPPSAIFNMDAFRRSPEPPSTNGFSDSGHSLSSEEFHTSMVQVGGARASLHTPALQVTAARRTTVVQSVAEHRTSVRNDSPVSQSSSSQSGSTPYETAPEASRPDLLVPISPLSPAYSPTAYSFSGRRDSTFTTTDSSEADVRWADERRRLSAGSQGSARPLSPSDGFAFPKPPGALVRGMSARRTSADRALLATIDETASRLSVASGLTTDSFVTAESRTLGSVSSTESPFTDEAAEVPHAFGERDARGAMRAVRRAFSPMRADELGVQRGEQVAVLKMFGDGWALVEKRAKEGAVTGLIPQACFGEL